ncbi:MAG: ABC transporter permease [Gemmatimonadaceae bacterium]
MARFSGIRRLFRLPSRDAHVKDDVDAELRFHLDTRAEELRASGASDADARARALDEFGDLDDARRYIVGVDAHRVRRARWHEHLADTLADVRYAGRAARRAPGFAIVAIATLALGIGANAAMFSIVNAVLVHGVPYAEPDRLVRIYENYVTGGDHRREISGADYLDYFVRQKSLSAMTAFAFDGFVYVDQAGAQLLGAIKTTSQYFDVLGVRAEIGRTFRAGEDVAGSHVAVLSHETFRRVFGGDPAVIGRAIELSDSAYVVIGVMPASFVPAGNAPDLWTPLNLATQMKEPNRARKFHNLGVFARLAPGVGLEAARANLMAEARKLELEHPDANTGHLLTVLPVREALLGDVRTGVLVLMGAATLVLLIACANIAGVTLSRALARRREHAIRIALGAGAGRLVRQMMAESIVVALVGGMVGLAVARWGTVALIALNPRLVPSTAHLVSNGAVLGFTLLVSIASGVLFGLGPAIGAARADPHAAMQNGGRGATMGGGRARLRGALAFAPVALAVALLVGAALLLRSVARLQGTDVGFDPSHLFTFRVSPPEGRYKTDDSQLVMFDNLLARLRALPGVTAVSSIGSLPLQGGSGAGLAIEGRPEPDIVPEIGYMSASSGYFATMKIPVLRGRDLASTDRATTPQVAVISAGMATRFWPGADPIGSRIRLGPNPKSPWIEVVGVVGDVRQNGADEAPRPMAYVAMDQDNWGSRAIVMRTRGDPASIAPAAEREVHAVDPRLPVFRPMTMEQVASTSLGRRRFTMALLGVFAAVAVTLAAVGVYGMLAFTVTARRQEFGIRMALGANRGDVFSLVLLRGVATIVPGIAAGLAIAFASGRAIGGLLYEVTPYDPIAFGGAALLLGVVALVACCVPARRATRVDPLVALRAD